MAAETEYTREDGYPEHYRDRRFTRGSGRGTHRREAEAIRVLLARCAETTGPWLDAPCGAGRLSGLLPAPRVQVDRSFEMVHAAPPTGNRACASVHALPFVDACFAGALCMRLLHHIPSSEERRCILREFRRVCRGPLVVSFFHAVSLQHVRRLLTRALGRTRSGRSAVRWSTFRADLEAAGYRVRETRPLRRFVSEQWIVLAEPY